MNNQELTMARPPGPPRFIDIILIYANIQLIFRVFLLAIWIMETFQLILSTDKEERGL